MTGFLLTLGGASCLCLSMPQHFRRVFRGATLTRPGRYSLRVAGYGLLAVAVYACADRHGIGVGLTVFTAYLTVAILAIALILPLVPDPKKRRTT